MAWGRLAAAGVAAAALLFAANAASDPGPVPGQAPGPPERLCGLNGTIDVLLTCETSAPTGSSSTTAASSPPPSSAAAAASTPELEAAAPVPRLAVQPTYLPNTLLVRFRSAVSAERSSALLARLGARTTRQIAVLHARMVEVEPGRLPTVLAGLQASPLVASAGRDPLVHVMRVVPNDANFSQQWGLQAADFPTAWEQTRGSSSVVVAVIDTGVDAALPDLAGAVLPGVNLVGGASAADDNGHGTAVAGVIAARADNGIGGAGVCWACSILPIKVLDKSGTGDMGTVSAGIVRATDLGARVINLSLGGPQGLDVLQQAVDYATGKGAVVVAAAGNNGVSTAFYPAAYDNVVSVAGTDQSNHLYSWSEYGSWVHIAAPGCNVAPLLDGAYGGFCGTSSATPLVSGLAALAISGSPQATNAQVAQAIETTARKVPADVVFGLIDAPAVLSALHVPAAPTVSTTVAFKGTLGASVRTRAYSRAVAAGVVDATVRFTGSRRLTLTVLNSDGQRLATLSGRSPLHLSKQFPAGRLRLVVAGSKRAKIGFTLTLTYPRP